MSRCSHVQAKFYQKRVVTALLYLNESDWDASIDGGTLKLFIGADADDDVGDTAAQVCKKFNMHPVVFILTSMSACRKLKYLRRVADLFCSIAGTYFTK